MSEMGNLDVGAPQENQGGVSESLSEDAKAKFAAAAAAMQQIRKEEKKSKKKDDQVAKTIVQFLGDKNHAHLFVLISRLVARDCPSIFILAVISLIDKDSREAVKSYLLESSEKTAEQRVDETTALTKTGELDAESNHILISWITRMQMVLSLDSHSILMKLMIDERNIDGTVLQLTTFVLQEFFASRNKEVAFEKLQPLTASILQTVFEPFMASIRKHFLEQAEAQKSADDED